MNSDLKNAPPCVKSSRKSVYKTRTKVPEKMNEGRKAKSQLFSSFLLLRVFQGQETKALLLIRKSHILREQETIERIISIEKNRFT